MAPTICATGWCFHSHAVATRGQDVVTSKVAIVAEYDGYLVDVLEDSRTLGYDLDEQFDILFDSSSIRDDMGREFRASILFSTEKASQRRGSELYRRYANALAYSPADYLRIRDCDGLFRFYTAAAIACNDRDNWLTESENRVLMEFPGTLYDATAFYKHRAEGEVCNLFAYVDADLRASIFQTYREVLWALDTTWGRIPDRRWAINFVRLVGGPVHMMMRRYRFVEDGMMVGRPETAHVVDETRRNVKLWYRSDPSTGTTVDERYDAVMAKRDRVLFDGLAAMLERPDEEQCTDCRRRQFYGTGDLEAFSGVELCGSCRHRWSNWMTTIAERAADVLPLSRAAGEQPRAALNIRPGPAVAIPKPAIQS